MRKLVRFNDKQTLAIDLLATDSTKSLEEIAVEVGVNIATLNRWRKDPAFIEAHYDRYMQMFSGKLPVILEALVREAKLGNVQAIRLALEHSGKLIKRVNHTIESPWDKWLNKQNMVKDNIQDAEVVEVVEDYDMQYDLPERDKSNEKPVVRAKKERKAIEKRIKSLTPAKKRVLNEKISPEQRAKNRKKSLNSYRRMKRAKKVGMKPLGKRVCAARERWYAELERREAELE